MQQKLFLTSLAFGAMLLTAEMAPAQSGNCGPRDAVAQRLVEIYSESRKIAALNGDNSLLELFASETTGTWTITITQGSGLTCIVAAGEHYQYLAEDLPNMDPDA